MPKFLISYLTSLVVFCAMDFLWLGLVVKEFYGREIGPLLLTSPQIEPAIAFYLLYVIGIVVFAVTPALAANRWQKALSHGALLGLIAYATYDLSNLATLKDWSARVAFVDICWGTVVTATAATAAFFLSKRMASRRT